MLLIRAAVLRKVGPVIILVLALRVLVEKWMSRWEPLREERGLVVAECYYLLPAHLQVLVPRLLALSVRGVTVAHRCNCQG